MFGDALLDMGNEVIKGLGTVQEVNAGTIFNDQFEGDVEEQEIELESETSSDIDSHCSELYTIEDFQD